MNNPQNRRDFLGTTAALIGAATLGNQKAFGMPALVRNLGDGPNSRINGVQIGTITHSFREMPDQSAEATLQYVLDCGISAVELMGGPAETFAGAPVNPVKMHELWPLRRKRQQNTLTEAEKQQLTTAEEQVKAYNEAMAVWRLKAPMAKFEQLKKLYNKAGVTIYAFKPDAFGMQNTDADINYGMAAAKTLGATHVTVEHPANEGQTLRLGQMAQKHGIRMGYHGHEQQTPTFWDVALAQSPGNALNFDLGHYVAAGQPDPLGLIRAKHDHIASMHIKDRQDPAHGKGNLPWGQGNTPLNDVLKLMRDQKYTFPASVELEYKIPEGSNAVAEVKKCVEFCRGILA
jgi:sugar phosphate isomerase/epimerase